MGQPIYQVDAFTDRVFGGNPAGVCPLDAPREAAWMQNVAMEMNLAETAFIDPRGDGWNLRWFTPEVEVDLCGHATLAAAHVLWESGRLPRERAARFHTRSGLLTCIPGDRGIEMDFPATPALPCPAPEHLLEALGVDRVIVARSKFDYLVEIESESQLRQLKPLMPALQQIDARGIIVTARSSSPEFDFVSRFFAPQCGVDEDPATGSSHCALAPWWQTKLGKSEMTGYQASKRGGVVGVKVAGERVILRGRAVTTLRGELVG